MAYRRTARLIDKGAPLDEVMEASGARSARQEFTDAMAEFERHRHSTRITLTAAALEEGMTIGQIARAWGFSRQLAARYAREPRPSSDGPPGRSGPTRRQPDLPGHWRSPG